MISQSQTIAKLLLERNAIQLRPQQPFTFSSGIVSPIYCDNRVLISYPEQRMAITQAFIALIEQHQLTFDVIAGTATAGIPHAAWLAQTLNLPMIYVRSKAKVHGKSNQIEGVLNNHQRVLVIEDLVSTGGSVINATEAIRQQGGIVSDCLCIFTYGMQQAQIAMSQASLHCRALTELNTLLETAHELHYITATDIPLIQQWQQSPRNWSAPPS